MVYDGADFASFDAAGSYVSFGAADFTSFDAADFASFCFLIKACTVFAIASCCVRRCLASGGSGSGQVWVVVVAGCKPSPCGCQSKLTGGARPPCVFRIGHPAEFRPIRVDYYHRCGPKDGHFRVHKNRTYMRAWGGSCRNATWEGRD